ncbi:MAG: site-specific DNA-methyltransferase, partial [Methylococcales bacterium]|nr:site-specific DNA-methyltransferase [Methylococcales bacterium]
MESTVTKSDALAYLSTLADSSVDLILTDPPYFMLKPIGWDRAWSNVDGFISWLREIALEWKRVLKPAGTLICFAGANPATGKGATNAARVEVMLGDIFNVIASCVWVKTDAAGNGGHMKSHREGLRAHFPQTERAIVCENTECDGQYDAAIGGLWRDVTASLRERLNVKRKTAGFTVPQCDTVL